jgi:hypothetical protein
MSKKHLVTASYLSLGMSLLDEPSVSLFIPTPFSPSTSRTEPAPQAFSFSMK